MGQTTASLGPVSAFIRRRLNELLNMQRVVVWYDPERAFTDLLPRLPLPGTVVISVAASRLGARREADAVYNRLNEGDGFSMTRSNLLIYVPAARGATDEAKQEDPFEGFARCGAAFGDQEGERLEALTEMALPERREEVARLFREGSPTLAFLDELPTGAQYPLLRQVFGAETPVEAISAAFTLPDAAKRLEAVAGALAELKRMLQAELGQVPGQTTSWTALRSRLASLLLTSALDADLADGLPPALSTVPHVEPGYQHRILDICRRLRSSNDGREVYVQLANEVERDLRLSSVFESAADVGARETFSFQERTHLRALVATAGSLDLAGMRAILEMGQESVWRREPERTLHWQVAQHCTTFLELALAAETRSLPSTTRSLLEAYVADDGLWQLDRAQRRYEHSAAHCAQDDEIEPLVQICRTRYQTVVQRAQGALQQAIRKEGWPPEDARRQTQTFDTIIAPELSQDHRVAYFLVDSLRYEMGRDLGEALRELGTITVEAAVTVLPTTTPCGMAALMPGADGAFGFVEQRGDLVPAVGGTLLPGVEDRKALIAARYGDRYADATLGEFLSTSQKVMAKRIGQADLLVVRTQDIDALGEGPSLYRARMVMSEVVSELKTAAIRLATMGFDRLVFAADHGHVLVPEVPAGDVLSVPPGVWLLKTRRSLLGQAQSTPPGLLYLPAQQMGIVGPVSEYVAASGFKTFRSDAGYFHEGLSLQECIVPVVTVRLAAPRASSQGGGEQVKITYRSDRFTSAVIGLKVSLIAMFTPSLPIRLEPFENSDLKARPVGAAGECDACDPATGEIMLQAGQETQVPLVIDPDYQGKNIEVRATDARTGAILDRLRLKNARMD